MSNILKQAQYGQAYANGYLSGWRNRIINGDMRIDQRSTGTAYAPAGTYCLDRWYGISTVANKYTVQQNAGSVTPPTGFSNYLGVTSSSSYTPAAGDVYQIKQLIEGFNFSDFMWGTPAAQPAVLSFWVRSSIPGVHGGAIVGSGTGANQRAYPFTYTVNAANTWEYKSILIPGDTSGTYSIGTNAAIQVRFGLGAAADVCGAAGSWSANNWQSASGAVSIVGTNGATWYVTGVQFEMGSAATPFERVDYSEMLRRCQRYYQSHKGLQLCGYAPSVGNITTPCFIVPKMRASPAVAQSNFSSSNATSVTINAANDGVITSFCAASASGTNFWVMFDLALSAEL